MRDPRFAEITDAALWDELGRRYAELYLENCGRLDKQLLWESEEARDEAVSTITLDVSDKLEDAVLEHLEAGVKP